MIATSSDIHGRLEALTAVLGDADHCGEVAVYNLGDLVGYGPNPAECVEHARHFALNSLSSATRSAGSNRYRPPPPATGYCPSTLACAAHSMTTFFRKIFAARRSWLASGKRLTGNIMRPYTHAGAFRQREGAGEWGYASSEDCGGFWRFDGDKTVINVGSVGQPRDGDWRACYVLLDGWDVTFWRVAYDVEATIRKVRAIPDIDDMQADRLREGR